MNGSTEQSHSDDTVNLVVYLALVSLTVATVAAGAFGHSGRLLAVSIAVIIASVKASLIGFYFMGLRRESSLTFVLLGIGLLAVLILFVGIFPDLTFRRL